jgi:hypothetical protein
MWSPIRKASEYTRFLASAPSLGHLIAETISSLARGQAASLSQQRESQPIKTPLVASRPTADATIDDLRIYSRPLSLTRINQLQVRIRSDQ